MVPLKSKILSDQTVITNSLISDKSKLEFQFIGEKSGDNYLISSNHGLIITKDFKTCILNPKIEEVFIEEGGKLWDTGWLNLRLLNSCLDTLAYLQYNFKIDKTPVDISDIKRNQEDIWFLSWAKGLFVYHNNEFIWFNEKLSDLDNIITDIAFDNDGNVFIAQNNGEILIAEFKNG